MTYKSNDLETKSAFKLKSEVIEIQNIKSGEVVGYGDKFKSSNNTRIAVIPVGYSDGLDLKYTGFNVSINNHQYKIVGVVNMGMITVEVDDKVSVGETVVVINDNIKKIASFIHTTPYVVMTSINKNVPRIYLKDNKIIKTVE